MSLWIRWGFESCGFTTNLTTELFAIAWGLKVAWLARYKKIVCASDSQLARSLIKEGVSRFHPHAAILDTIRLVISRDWQVSFIHTLREANSCADWLAKTGGSSDDTLVTWQSCTTQLSSILLADVMGVVHLRS